MVRNPERFSTGSEGAHGSHEESNGEWWCLDGVDMADCGQDSKIDQRWYHQDEIGDGFVGGDRVMLLRDGCRDCPVSEI